MNISPFLDAGLTATQAEVLGYLLEHGQTKAIVVSRETKRPRGVVYKALEELAAMGLAEKLEKAGEVATFRAEHPHRLEHLFTAQKEEAQQKHRLFLESLPLLVSAYNLGSKKPGVKFLEGEDGMRAILDDTLRSQTDVYLIINTQALSGEDAFTKLNEEYKKRRTLAQVKKKIIRIGEPAPVAADANYKSLTEIRYLKNPSLLFKSSMQIYDNKVSFQIIDNGTMISILIEDKNIYEMLKGIFETVWEVLLPQRTSESA